VLLLWWWWWWFCIQRWRLQERLGDVEEGLTTVAQVLITTTTEKGCPTTPLSNKKTYRHQPTVPLPIDSLPDLPEDDPLWIEAEKEKKNLEANKDAVTGVVRYTVKPHFAHEFEDIM